MVTLINMNIVLFCYNSKGYEILTESIKSIKTYFNNNGFIINNNVFINPLTTNVPHHICDANQLTSFYMMENIAY